MRIYQTEEFNPCCSTGNMVEMNYNVDLDIVEIGVVRAGEDAGIYLTMQQIKDMHAALGNFLGGCNG